MDRSRILRGMKSPSLLKLYLQYSSYNLYNKIFSSSKFYLPEEYRHNERINVHEYKEKLVELKSVPRRLTVVIGKQCNLKCRMCNYAISQAKDDPRYLDSVWSEYQIVYPYLSTLYMNGGEPLLYQKSKEFVRLGLSNDHLKIRLSTNMNILDHEWIDLLGSGRIDLSVSLDAASAKTYAFIRTGGNLHRVLKNLQRIKAVQKKATDVTLNFIVMNVNHRELNDFVGLAKDIGATTVNFQRLAKSHWQPTFYQEQRIDRDERMLAACRENLAAAKSECAAAGIQYSSNLDHYGQLLCPTEPTQTAEDALSSRQDLACRTPWDHISISPERSSLCCWAKQKFFFSSRSVIFLWNSKIMMHARRHFKDGNYHHVCTDRCPQYAEYLGALSKRAAFVES